MSCQNGCELRNSPEVSTTNLNYHFILFYFWRYANRKNNVLFEGGHGNRNKEDLILV